MGMGRMWVLTIYIDKSVAGVALGVQGGWHDLVGCISREIKGNQGK